MPLNPAWQRAFETASSFLRKPQKMDADAIGERTTDAATRRRAHRLVQAWLRERGRVHEAMRPWLRKKPRPALCTVLELAGTELALADSERHPAIVHHAVAATKRLLSVREAGMVNAVLRRVAETLPQVGPEHAHPAWLVDRWNAHFGPTETARLLAWNQQEPALYVRWADPSAPPPEAVPTPWPGFYRVETGRLSTWLPFLETGGAYIQDPFTRHPVGMALASQPRTLLDLCAAPGGKSRALLDTAGQLEKLVAVDLPGVRLARLEENLAKDRYGDTATVLGTDVRKLSDQTFAAAELPTCYDAVVLDVPCSNTGVIGRRPDVRWLLTPAQIDALVALQAELLDVAARLVAPGGTLVYSTCSLEREENEAQIEAFLDRHPTFEPGTPYSSLPSIEGHDGGGAFPLTRLKPNE